MTTPLPDTTSHRTDDGETRGEIETAESTVQEQLALIDQNCFDQNLNEYIAQHSEIPFTAVELKSAIQKVIKGGKISRELLTILREHASLFYQYTKQKPRSVTIPANMGFKDWSDRYRDRIRAIMGKIDAIMGLSAKLEERVPGFNLAERVSVRADQLKELGMMLGLGDDVAEAMSEELIEMVRQASLPYTQDYAKLKKFAKDLSGIEATSVGVDFSRILAKYWNPSSEELKGLLSKDFTEGNHFRNYTTAITREEALRATIENKSSEGYRTILLLAALRKTLGGNEVMAPVNTHGILDQNEVPIIRSARKNATIFLYNIGEGLVRAKGKSQTSKSEDKPKYEGMRSLAQWLSMTFARLMNNQKLQSPAERTLHDGMSVGTPFVEYGLQAPNFDRRQIILL